MLPIDRVSIINYVHRTETDAKANEDSSGPIILSNSQLPYSLDLFAFLYSTFIIFNLAS